MRRPFIANAALAALVCVACDAGAGAGPDPVGGRLVVQRVAKRTTKLSDGPGLASYCPADSLLLVIAIGRAWTSGFAVRVALPLREAGTFKVQRLLGDLGTATAAFRPIGEGAAQLGVGGTLRLEPSSGIRGGFEVAVPDSGGVHISFRGRWSRIPLRRLPRGSCRSG